MRAFKIWNVEDSNTNFVPEIEFDDTGERRRFVFPKGEGWESPYGADGEPKFIVHICRLLEDEEAVSSQSSDVGSFSDSFSGRVFSEPVKPKVVSSNVVERDNSRFENDGDE